MTAVRPYGNPATTAILIIGHDPRLQNSLAEAEYAFFLDYLLHPRSSRASEARKYDLACALQGYISDLAGQEIPLQSLYVTNLYNEFLPPTHGHGTVLIPDDLAEQGLADILHAITQSHFRLILPLSAQVCYHLAHLGFFDEADDGLQTFIRQARPAPDKAVQGVYVPSGTAPFLEMCGRCFHHRSTPVVPVLHVKQWPLRAQMTRYVEPMLQAAQEIRRVLAE